MGHRSTKELPSHADVVIIGAGITGVNAARFLVESGKVQDIVLVEAREVCWGATGRVR
jgi:glycine/D-amino acid oxidase-like deaminating enzyme